MQVFADDWKPKTADEIKTIQTECMEESSLTEEQKTQIHNFNFADEEAVRKYLLCKTKKMGLFCPHEGKFIADRVAEQFKVHTEGGKVKTIGQECITKYPKDNKEDDVYVYEIHKCFVNSEIGKNIRENVKKH